MIRFPVLRPAFRLFAIGVLTSIALVSTAAPSRADTINFFSTPGTEGLGTFSGSLSVTNLGTQSILTFSVTNTTTPASIGGVITGIAFNDPSGSSALIGSVLLDSVKVNGVDYTSSYNLFGGNSFNNTVAGNPFGNFDVGTGTGNNLLGGKVLNGVPTADPGETAVFTYTINWDSAYAPAASDFMNAMSQGGSESSAMLVRYQGFSVGAGSDKVPNTVGGTPSTAVPAPPALLLSVIGIGVMGLFRRRMSP